MKRGIVTAALFALFVGLTVGHAGGRPGPGTGPGEFLIKWEWFDKDSNVNPRLVAVPGKTIKRGEPPTDQQVYKLVAKGNVVFPDELSTVIPDKCAMWVYHPVTGTNGYPAEPNKKYLVKVGAKERVPPTVNQWRYPVEVISTANDKEDGDAYPYFADQKLQVKAVIVYKHDPAEVNTLTLHSAVAFAEAK